MKKLIKGTHHVALRCKNPEEFEKVINFYHNVLGLDILRRWGEGEKSAIMLDTGDSIIEIFAVGKGADCTGGVNHFALATDDVDACIETVRAYGCPITMEPKDIVITSEIPVPARVAFCIGPVDEEIEFFCEK